MAKSTWYLKAAVDQFLALKADLAALTQLRSDLIDTTTGKLRSSLIPPASNAAPVASFTKSTNQLTAVFDGTSSYDVDGTIASYAWTFGDGTTSALPSPSKTYAAAGTYTVTLRVLDNAGASNTVSQTVTVSASATNTPPTASFTSTKSGLLVSVDGSNSTDPGGTVVSWAWTFGDGTTATGKTASRTYAVAGTYTVGLTVTDDKGATGSTSQNITVTAAATGTLTPVAAGGRWWIPFGSAPHARTTYQSLYWGSRIVTWVGSMPDTRARTTPREMGVSVQAQQAYQVQIVAVATNTVVHDSGVLAGNVETYTVPNTVTLTPGAIYTSSVRVQAASGTWSDYSYPTRAVIPTGVTRYLEDYAGTDGDITGGVVLAGANYNGSPADYGQNHAIRKCIAACARGDAIEVRKKGTTLANVTAAGAVLTQTAGGFTSAMIGKKIVIYGAGYVDATGLNVVYGTVQSYQSPTQITLTAAVPTNGSGYTVLVDPTMLWTGHIDNDQGNGGYFFNGLGAIFFSKDPNSAGFRTTVPDVTYANVHYQHQNVLVRGSGKNNNDGSFFIEGAGAVGIRLVNVYCERSQDAGVLFYNGCSDCHVVSSTSDHTLADPFHVTGKAHHIQFTNDTVVYGGDDAAAMIGYRSDGDAGRPHDIYWVGHTLKGQDWGRGISFGGVYNALVTGFTDTGDALASILMGSDGDQANSYNCQVRDVVIKSPSSRRGLKPVYSQGANTTSVVADDPWLKILNAGSPTQQRDFLIENVQVDSGRYGQILSYGNGPFKDLTIIMRGIIWTGDTSTARNWFDDSTYSGHIDLRGNDVSAVAGTTAASAPPNAGTGIGA